MRRIVLLPALLLLLPLAPLPATAQGSDPLVDAGASVQARVGVPFPLAGHVEDFAGPPSIAWSAPEGCTIDDAFALATTATCADVGAHAFTLTAQEGSVVVSDSVQHAVVGERTTNLIEVADTTLVGVGAVCCGALPKGGWVPGPNHGPYPFEVAPGTTRVVLSLNWTSTSPGINDDLDIFVHGPNNFSTRESATARPKSLTLEGPAPGAWEVYVSPGLAADRADWRLYVNATSPVGPQLPVLHVPGAAPSALDGLVRLQSRVAGASEATIQWEWNAASRRFDDAAGPSIERPFEGATLVRARATTSEGWELDAVAPVHARGALARPFTVVAVVDSSFSPYHFDFLGSQHPWNLDNDTGNDLDFNVHPAAYIPEVPDVAPLSITIPTQARDGVDALRGTLDAPVWASMQRSNASDAFAYWFPGTKVIAALKFSSVFEGGNAAHGTASAASAAGNVHGTCPECLFVLVSGSSDAALSWAAKQPWIDVVTNSYGAGSFVQTNTSHNTRDNAYWRSPVEVTRDASEEGQVIVFSAGNGLANAFDVPMFTYWSSQKGPDWYVTVGAVDPAAKQTYSGAGKPVDISSIGSGYPSSGGTSANGTGTHGGTSNAAPVVAGYFAKAIQKAREALGDATVGHAGGVVASGPPIPCGVEVPACALGDGVLTRRELEDAVYASVLPSEPNVAADTIWPTTPLAYYYQGHGVLYGRLAGPAGDAAYEREWGLIVEHLRGDFPGYPRPAGETNWFVVDSKCRQHLWGEWNGGLYTGTTPAMDPVNDPVAMKVDAWCSALPPKPFHLLLATGFVP